MRSGTRATTSRVGSALFTAFVRIPLGTVLFEEIAFRGVLWALLARHLGRWWVLGITSVLFGMWHVLAATHFGGANAGVNDVVRLRAARRS